MPRPNPAKLRHHREAAGLRQQDLADRLGVEQPRVCEWETGVHVPSAETLWAIAAALGVEPTDLVE
jgi:transcriptional regulator with XRE-family HTH domain